MIFTLGLKHNYEQYLNEYPLLQKLGRTEGYSGGTVWNTYPEAKRCCPEGYEVYGVLADWETQTAVSIEQTPPAHDLLITSPLVRISAKTKRSF